jgi:hypothetical protein
VIKKVLRGRASNFWAFLDKGNSKTRLKKTRHRACTKVQSWPNKVRTYIFFFFPCRPLYLHLYLRRRRRICKPTARKALSTSKAEGCRLPGDKTATQSPVEKSFVGRAAVMEQDEQLAATRPTAAFCRGTVHCTPKVDPGSGISHMPHGIARVGRSIFWLNNNSPSC